MSEPWKDYVNLIGEITNIKPTRENPRFKSKYIDLADLLKETRPILKNNNCALSQFFMEDGGKLFIATKIVHMSGEVLASSYLPINPTDAKHNTPIQQLGSDISYLRRYSIATLLGISADEDADGNDIVQSTAKEQPKIKTHKNVTKLPNKDMSADDKKRLLGILKDRVVDCKTIDDLAEVNNDFDNGPSWSEAQIDWFYKLLQERAKSIKEMK